VEQERQARLLTHGPQPLVTFYDLGTGERAELSHTTVDNWVNKTAALILDAALDAGDVISVALPTHWQRMVWWLAAWKVGVCVADAPPVDETAQLLVCSTSQLDTTPSTLDTVACSLRPMGLPADTPLPGNVTDYAIDVRRFPDQLTTPMPDSQAPAFRTADGSWSQSELLLTRTPLADSTRLLVTNAKSAVEQAQLIAATLASPGSSIVLVTSGGEVDDWSARLDSIALSEQITQRA
jgi:acyl-CoA synthetase (AMP-forming)/AMP-acid ligase II